jgi:hypothetical protein
MRDVKGKGRGEGREASGKRREARDNRQEREVRCERARIDRLKPRSER